MLRNRVDGRANFDLLDACNLDGERAGGFLILSETIIGPSYPTIVLWKLLGGFLVFPSFMEKKDEIDRVSSTWAARYRGATVEDLDLASALSVRPNDSIQHALINAYERDYTHLTVVAEENRALLGYLSIPRLKKLLKDGACRDTDAVQTAMQRFRRRGKVYRVITMNTPLEELEFFFTGAGSSKAEPQDFAVVTDESRRFVLGVATTADLAEFVKRRPA